MKSFLSVFFFLNLFCVDQCKEKKITPRGFFESQTRPFFARFQADLAATIWTLFSKFERSGADHPSKDFADLKSKLMKCLDCLVTRFEEWRLQFTQKLEDTDKDKDPAAFEHIKQELDNCHQCLDINVTTLSNKHPAGCGYLL